MKRSRSKRRAGLGGDAEKLIWLATGLAESGSRVEDLAWENQLVRALTDCIADHDEDILNRALDHLYGTDGRAFEALADFIEATTETAHGLSDTHDVVLLAAPVLAWSRFRIPAGTVPPAVLANLRVHLAAHVLAENARLALADYLFSPDQLPQGYVPTALFAQAIGKAALEDADLRIDTEGMPETTHFLSDTRYLLAAVAVPRGQPLFAWQSPGHSREQALLAWRNQGGACLAPMLPGCAMEVVLPETFFAASRQADRASRPYAIRASVAFLGTELHVPAAELRAVIAPFHDKQLEEYRISFTTHDSDDVVHGVVWPLLGPEDEDSEIHHDIEQVLRECGIIDVTYLEHNFPLEYSEEYGTPLYPSPEGELVHAELPEEQSEQPPRHLH